MERLVAAALLFVMLFSLAACGGSGNPSGETENADTKTPEKTDSGIEKVEGKLPGGKLEKPAKTDPTPLQLLLGGGYEGEWGENGLLCSADWDSVILAKESAAIFPALDEVLRARALKEREIHLQELKEILPLAEAEAEVRDDFGGYTSTLDYVVQRADDRILSIRLDGGRYTGGAHPEYWAVGLNYDPATGKELDVSHVLTDVEALPAILTELIREKYTFEEFPDLQEQLEGYEPEQFSWTMGYQGITFYFSPYEIAPYAAGLLTATLWFDEMPELFEQKYTAAPAGGWVAMLPMYNEVEVDLDSRDGEKDVLYLSEYQYEEGTKELYLTRNGEQWLLEECFGYVLKPMLVAVGAPGEERYFLYIEATVENDYNTIYTYDLNGKEIVLTGELFGCGLPSIWDETVRSDGMWCEAVLTDPTAFELETRIQLLGTNTGMKTYTADAKDGTPCPQEDYYEILQTHRDPIVSAMEMEVTMLPQRKTATLPAGTAYRFLRTDGETYVELKLEDGKTCRVEIEFEDYTVMINGVPEWEYFWDLPYAG